jgi:xanthine dehydrogenase molybdopterin-binding subunit B
MRFGFKGQDHERRTRPKIFEKQKTSKARLQHLKISVASHVPKHFQAAQFDNQNLKLFPFGSKAVGEPPLLLALSS